MYGGVGATVSNGGGYPIYREFSSLAVETGTSESPLPNPTIQDLP
jgi:hypothetical protein